MWIGAVTKLFGICLKKKNIYIYICAEIILKNGCKRTFGFYIRTFKNLGLLVDFVVALTHVCCTSIFVHACIQYYVEYACMCGCISSSNVVFFFTGEVAMYVTSYFSSVDKKPNYLDYVCLYISCTISRLYS